MEKIISSIRNEALSIESLLIDLDPLTWSKETSFKSWSPEIIISHLLYFDRMTIYSHQDKDKFNREASFLFKAFSNEINSLKRAKLVFDRLAIHEQSSMIDAWKKSNQEMTTIFINAEAEIEKNISERWKADMASDNKLAKSVRPLTLIFLFVSTVLLIFIDSGFITFVVDDEWKELLKLILMTTVAAYFGGRSYEKGTKIKNK